MYQFTSPIISEIIFCDYTVVIEISCASPIWLCKIVNFSINRNLNSESGLAHLAELISSICGVIMFKYRMPPNATNFNLDHHNYLNYVVGCLGKMFVIFDKSKYHTLSIYGDQEWYNGEIINVYKPGLTHVRYFLGQERMFLISAD